MYNIYHHLTLQRGLNTNNQNLSDKNINMVLRVKPTQLNFYLLINWILKVLQTSGNFHFVIYLLNINLLKSANYICYAVVKYLGYVGLPLLLYEIICTLWGCVIDMLQYLCNVMTPTIMMSTLDEPMPRLPPRVHRL